MIATDVPKQHPEHKGRINPEYVALWKSYIDEGMSHAGVANLFGVSKDSVNRHYPGTGWTNEEGLEHGRSIRDFNRKMRRMATSRAK